jgi:D-xylose 1-dehydrogenase (NADP+, D-xylono-1,5-lactone-forming)
VVRIGILSVARIAAEFAAAVKSSEHVSVSAVASRTAARATAFANDHGIPSHFGSYAELLQSSDVDAVYIPLPNSLHAEWAVRAAEAGKHVLCEKPLALTVGEARRMFAAADANGVRLVEGYPYRAQPQMAKLQQLLREGAIGRIRFIHASFGYPLKRTSDIRLDSTLGGGALMDAGCYAVSMVRMVSGSRPLRVHALAQMTEGGVDRALIGSMELADGVLAQISCSFETALHRQVLIVGTEGVIETSFLNQPPLDRPATIRLRREADGGVPSGVIETQPVNGFLALAESFERSIRLGAEHWVGPCAEESLDIAITLEALLHSAGTGRMVKSDALSE